MRRTMAVDAKYIDAAFCKLPEHMGSPGTEADDDDTMPGDARHYFPAGSGVSAGITSSCSKSRARPAFS